jgi:hypothetical protein
MTNDDLYSSGIFASELEDDFGAGEDKELNPDDFLDDDLGEDTDDEDLLDDEDDEASYNPLEDYKSDEWG